MELAITNFSRQTLFTLDSPCSGKERKKKKKKKKKMGCRQSKYENRKEKLSKIISSSLTTNVLPVPLINIINGYLGPCNNCFATCDPYDCHICSKKYCLCENKLRHCYNCSRLVCCGSITRYRHLEKKIFLCDCCHNDEYPEYDENTGNINTPDPWTG
jgi:hypothetical protein